jgi:hypothetical protein
MKRGTKLLLGVSVALITAAALHYTVGPRFHEKRFGHFEQGDCERNWSRHKDKMQESPSPLGSPKKPI